jgi:hypothetical protein
MGLLDTAREKASSALGNADRDIADRTAERDRAQDALNQVMQAADDRQVADRSTQEAEIKDLQIQLKDAQSKLDADKAVHELTTKVTDLPLISGPTESIRQTTSAIVAQGRQSISYRRRFSAKAEIATPNNDDDSAVAVAQARLDRANSRLATAKARQGLAAKALDAMNGLKDGS